MTRSTCEHGALLLVCDICWPPSRSNSDVLAGWLNDREFEIFIAYRPAPHFYRPDIDVGDPEGYGVDFFDVGDPIRPEGVTVYVGDPVYPAGVDTSIGEPTCASR